MVLSTCRILYAPEAIYGNENRLSDITDQAGTGTCFSASSSQKTGLAKNTLTAMLGRMEDAGLIARKAAKADKRQSLIVLTQKAKSLQGKYDEVSQKMNEIFYKGFTEKEALKMDSYLDRILDNLEQSERSLKNGKDD